MRYFSNILCNWASSCEPEEVISRVEVFNVVIQKRATRGRRDYSRRKFGEEGMKRVFSARVSMGNGM